MKHILGVIAVIAAITLAAWVWLGRSFDQLLPLRASEESFFVDRLLGMQFYVIAFLFALIIGFMLYSIFVFRRKPGDDSDGDYFHGNTTLEIMWTVVPLGVVLYFAVVGAGYLGDITAPESNELVVQVTGSQWNWRFDYPRFGISSPELNLPKGQQTVLEISSIDVIHSFWVPEFRLKQDAVPGMVHPLRITPTEVGTYVVRCAEICGKDHSYMLANVNVMEQNAFEAWVRAQVAPPSGGLAEAGAKIAKLNGCLGCHSVDGSTITGPTWLDLFGEEVQLADGSTVVADEAYIMNSILNPGEQIVAGFDTVAMPANFGAVLSEDDLEALVAYIASLSTHDSTE
ncbi:MAG: cytochrome c oxidase subunit II [Ardenticatenaceae bacterium]|nr:cytochrome c oxidase subunit II [Ardenticatenaceae bacterium]MCB9443894.1 cytochrome c oxidase subunit II [Ardenticatenaceae bacterium]